MAVVVVDVFCGDISNTRQTSSWQNNPNSGPKPSNISLDGKGTTPRSVLSQRVAGGGTTPQSSRGPARKWIQQNNIWIKNEQGASGSQVTNSNQQQVGGNIGGQNVNTGGTRANLQGQQAFLDNLRGTPETRGSSTVRPPVHQNNRQQQALVNGLINNQQNVGSQKSSTISSTTPKTNSVPPLNRQISTNPTTPPLKPTPSKPTLPPNKPLSYADAVGPKSPIPAPSKIASSPSLPSGDRKKDSASSTGPTSNTEKVEENENVSFSEGDATDDELRDFSEMLLRKDVNNAMKFVTLNLQGMTTSRSSNDEAPLPLLKIAPDAYKIPSVEKIMLLYNNYFLEASQNEVYTGAERIEENNLLDTILATPVIQFARSFLIQKGKLGKDPKEFKDLLRQIWFNMYSRGQGRIGSSGFEHVFVAEVKNNQVSGLHNWLYFNEEENQNRANYLGYMKKLDLGEKGAILKYHFTFHDIDKPVGSMFIGTSPELEIALYSVCFLLRADKICPLKMNGNKFIIRTYTYRYRSKNMIGSAFPEI